jgi:AcrR family transcriptional regulator
MMTIQEKALAVWRQHVLDAATTVFARKGFRGATSRDIVIAAGVSDGTIYNLFHKKAALLHAILAGAQRLPIETAAGNEMAFLPDMVRERWIAIGADSLAMQLRVILSEALLDPDVAACIGRHCSIQRLNSLPRCLRQILRKLTSTAPADMTLTYSPHYSWG